VDHEVEAVEVVEGRADRGAAEEAVVLPRPEVLGRERSYDGQTSAGVPEGRSPRSASCPERN
jgi:hypothetical protein